MATAHDDLTIDVKMESLAAYDYPTARLWFWK